ncbi:MAG: beta-ketoacyl-[acyl-carrier-protein] synthase family protein [Bacteroidales bacterium]|nr:beta-ketoacyl-[acyl-carrier-protein] synthase family protein [Bacteroidales bacterium]
MRRVVITGMGIWSCIGTSPEEVRDSLYNGKSGIGVENERLAYGFQSPLTGIVPKPSLKGLLDRHLRRGLSEEAEYAFMAGSQALEMAGMPDAYLDSHEIGCIFGNDSSAKPVIETDRLMRETRDSGLLGQSYIFQAMNSTVNMNLSTIFRLKGINFTVSAACASGSHSIGLAYLFIKNGLQDAVLCGGAQETNYFSMASFDALGAFSKRAEQPGRASRPFDRDRDGLVPSGGGAALVLEEYERARARGATILAEVVGYGFSSNGTPVISQPSAEGCSRAMRRALEDAGMEPGDIDYVNAHATGTRQGDLCEAQALRDLFGGERAYISSTKGMTGHECWMAGASEIVYCLLMMQHGFVAPNLNFENGDEFSRDLHIARTRVEMSVNTVLSNSFGFGGTNSALIIKKM